MDMCILCNGAFGSLHPGSSAIERTGSGLQYSRLIHMQTEQRPVFGRPRTATMHTTPQDSPAHTLAMASAKGLMSLLLPSFQHPRPVIMIVIWYQ